MYPPPIWFCLNYKAFHVPTTTSYKNFPTYAPQSSPTCWCTPNLPIKTLSPFLTFLPFWNSQSLLWASLATIKCSHPFKILFIIISKHWPNLLCKCQAVTALQFTSIFRPSKELVIHSSIAHWSLLAVVWLQICHKDITGSHSHCLAI